MRRGSSHTQASGTLTRDCRGIPCTAPWTRSARASACNRCKQPRTRRHRAHDRTSRLCSQCRRDATRPALPASRPAAEGHRMCSWRSSLSPNPRPQPASGARCC
eukprot:7385034-Prymnesium_polylepis.1